VSDAELRGLERKAHLWKRRCRLAVLEMRRWRQRAKRAEAALEQRGATARSQGLAPSTHAGW